MFYKLQPKNLQNKYKEYLSIIGSLSQLFSDSKVPYLYYRVAEKIFCEVFEAVDLSRGDIALDASKGRLGIGLKTFLKNNNYTLQKVAEFNKDRELYEKKSDKDIVYTISQLRNERIRFAQNISNVKDSIYHCVLRDDSRFFLYEEKMNLIDISNIYEVKRSKNSIWFHDNRYEYNFNLSKSTLFKRFETKNIIDDFEVKIYDNPLNNIKECLSDDIFGKNKIQVVSSIYLPLYGKNKIVSPKSGLNQWNASGRTRDSNEIYIPIPSKIHKLFPDFFPDRDKTFELILPNKKSLLAKVCQDNSKALMTNPNKALGKWLLRDVLELKEGEVLTYEKLQRVGIDSVKIDKFEDGSYQINFAQTGSFEDFINLLS